MKNYSDFNSVEELYEYYNIGVGDLVLEKNKVDLPDKDGKDEDEPSKTINPDNKLDVLYADFKKPLTNIFKHIMIFTNSKDPKDNKTLKNIIDAIKELKKANCEIIPELHMFIASDVYCTEEDEKLTISDGEETFAIIKESNLDTLIFSRLSVQDEDQCEHVVRILQDRGFLVLNPVKYSALACDKYESALLFQKGNIPQPNFTLMTKDILYDEKLYLEAMKQVYPKWDIDGDKNADYQVVMKILDGHGGTGVALIDGKRMYAILQMIFAISPDRQILLQKKEEADGGDIRVHVLTLRDKQVILAAMKRVKLGGDFRSNVSLGAEAEPVKLTSEQEQIALKTAQLSKLPWCAVDIMPLVKGSNKELGDNAVLEINASPGTAGISDVIETNFINVLLNELDDPNLFYLQDKIAGFIESITINFGDGVSKDFLAKLDTGNSTKASVLEVGKFTEKGNYIEFQMDNKTIKLEKIGQSNAIAGDKAYKRPMVVVPEMQLGLRKLKNVAIALVENRDQKMTNLLLNRDVMSKMGYVVHPNNAHILTKEMEKVKII